MGFSSRGVTSAEIQAAIVDDATRYSGADIPACKHGEMTFWGLPTASVSLTNSLTDFTLGNIVIPDIPDITILAAYPVFSIGYFRELAGTSNYAHACYLQFDKDAAGWTNALQLVSEWIKPNTNAESMGTEYHSTIDLLARVALNATTNVRLYQAKANSTSILLTNIRAGVRVIY